MEFNKPVSNPMLMGSIELMKAEDTPAHRNMFIGELSKASFLSPAVIEPAPELDKDGKHLPMPVKEGDKVIYGKYGGTEITVDGEDVLILRADDIYAVVE